MFSRSMSLNTSIEPLDIYASLGKFCVHTPNEPIFVEPEPKEFMYLLVLSLLNLQHELNVEVAPAYKFTNLNFLSISRTILRKFSSRIFLNSHSQ